MKKSRSHDRKEEAVQRPAAGPKQSLDTPWGSWIWRAELACCIALVVAIVAFHWQTMTHAGALWRDEINTASMASMPALGEIVKNLEFDSFPILWFLAVRSWIHVGFGSDLGFRVLGMIVGIAGCASLVWCCRKLGSRIPLVGLVLLGFCPTAFVIGDSLRAYGCGFTFMLLTLGMLWKAVEDPRPRRVLLAGVFAIVSVQCVYYNSILLFAAGMGGVAVGLRRRDWRVVAYVLGIGIAAAVTLTPYLAPIKRAGSWNLVFRMDFTLPWMMAKFQEAVEPAGRHVYWIWLALTPIAIAACAWRWFRPTLPANPIQKDRSIFIATTLVTAIAGYTVFLKALSYPTQPWYYLSILAVLAALLDAGTALFFEATISGRIVRLGFAVVVAATTFSNTWDWVQTRQTNMDLVAAKLESLAGKDDLIVINPFFFGVSFARYYHGQTPWVTVPQLTEYRIHRYDMFKDKMAEARPNASIHEKIISTSGRRPSRLDPGVVELPQGGRIARRSPAGAEFALWLERRRLLYGLVAANGVYDSNPRDEARRSAYRLSWTGEPLRERTAAGCRWVAALRGYRERPPLTSFERRADSLAIGAGNLPLRCPTDTRCDRRPRCRQRQHGDSSLPGSVPSIEISAARCFGEARR